MTFDHLNTISTSIVSGDVGAIDQTIQTAFVGERGKHWDLYLTRLRLFAIGYLEAPPFSIIGEKGNEKLGKSFLTFSTLPGVTCPGAGDCLDVCYSFRSWRHPAAYARQAQNTMLLQTARGRDMITRALDYVTRDKEEVVFRLYVDGDFSCAADLDFWMDALYTRPHIRAYGYSKSLELFLARDWFPENYILNVSSGHRYPENMEMEVAALPCSRGAFRYVDAGKNPNAAQVRAAYGARCFVCPGECSNCTTRGHACGSESFRGIDIVIGTH